MSRVNTRYCRPTDGGLGIEYAPVIFPPSPNEPTEADNFAHGFYRNETGNLPQPPEGKIVMSKRFEVVDGIRVVTVYEYGDKTYTIEDYDRTMETHLLSERSARGYTTREPDAYLASSNARWKQDAEDWVAHRDAVMEYALGIMNAVHRGEIEPPTMDEFINGLPRIKWSIAE